MTFLGTFLGGGGGSPSRTRENGRAGVKGRSSKKNKKRKKNKNNKNNNSTIVQSFLESLCAHFQSRTSVVTELASRVPSPTY